MKKFEVYRCFSRSNKRAKKPIAVLEANDKKEASSFFGLARLWGGYSENVSFEFVENSNSIVTHSYDYYEILCKEEQEEQRI